MNARRLTICPQCSELACCSSPDELDAGDAAVAPHQSGATDRPEAVERKIERNAQLRGERTDIEPRAAVGQVEHVTGQQRRMIGGQNARRDIDFCSYNRASFHVGVSGRPPHRFQGRDRHSDIVRPLPHRMRQHRVAGIVRIAAAGSFLFGSNALTQGSFGFTKRGHQVFDGRGSGQGVSLSINFLYLGRAAH